MTNGQRSAIAQSVIFLLLLFALPVILLARAPEAASRAAWATIGAAMLALFELMAACAWQDWTGRARVQCRACQRVHGINEACPRCGAK